MKETTSKKVWVVWTNTDLTEGRGRETVKVVCEKEATAKRLAKGAYVMGSDCPIKEGEAVRLGGQWLIPGRIIHPTTEDLEENDLTEKEKVIKKAKDAGLSNADIMLLAS